LIFAPLLPPIKNLPLSFSNLKKVVEDRIEVGEIGRGQNLELNSPPLWGILGSSKK
jgi:hypothetical protein